MKPVKIFFCDTWEDQYNNRFTRMFQRIGIKFIIDTENPDYILYSVFGNGSYKKYKNAKKVFICWEPINVKNDRRLKDSDYSITYYSNIEDNIRHFYYQEISEEELKHQYWLMRMQRTNIL